MLTLEDARTYLASLGITLPDPILQLLVDQINSVYDCLVANYDATTIGLIQYYLLSLLGFANGDRYVTSERAPSGASRSYQFRSLMDKWRSVYGLLLKLDTHGCTLPLIPPEPGSSAGLWVGTAKGCCNE